MYTITQWSKAHLICMMFHFLQSKKQYILDYDNLIRLFYLPFILAMKKSCKNAMLCLWCGGALQIIMTECFLILWYSCFEDSRTTLDKKTNMNLKWIFNIFQTMGFSYKKNNWLRSRMNILFIFLLDALQLRFMEVEMIIQHEDWKVSCSFQALCNDKES